MLVSKRALENAREIVAAGTPVLPAQLPAAPAFYVALSSDESIQAFGGFVHGNLEYVVGIRRQ